MPKSDNMLTILWMLNLGTKVTAKQISEKLEINIRAVYRYVDALCASGVPIISDTGHNDEEVRWQGIPYGIRLY